MQPNLKLNPHGIVGALLIILMFGIAFFLDWNINWWYFAIAVVLYSAIVIPLTLAEEAVLISRWLLGCHLALLFLAVGLFFPDSTGWAFFLPSIGCGLTIPFLLLRTSQNKNSLHLHGLVALLLIILMIGVAFLYRKNLSEEYAQVYFLCALMAIVAYAAANIRLNPDFSSGISPSQILKLQLGCHLAFILLIVGFGLPLKDVGSVIAFFLVSVAVGLAIPYLLLRGSL